VLVAAAETQLSLRQRDGSVVTVAVDDVEAGRVVPPGPARTVSVAELQRVMASGWRALEVEPLGDWLLRAAGGFTRRANSALVVGDPGRPLDAAVAAVQEWYDARGLPARVQVPAAEGAGLAPVLAARGWTVATTTHVLTAEAAHVLRAVPDRAPLSVRIDAQPDDAWLDSYRSDAHPLPPVARDVLTNHPVVGFASVREGGRCLAVARVAVDGVWAGLFGVEVDPAYRRRGLGQAVTAAALRWAVDAGARRTYLQVVAANEPAVALWQRLGYEHHHDYVYATAGLT
jgi:ribosomal protein S18 acetylase RimI-like enzyme